MRQFYQACRDDEKVAALLRQLPWTPNLIILNQSQQPEDREFCLRQAICEQWSSRELERQFKIVRFERSLLNPVKAALRVPQTHPAAQSVFKDRYRVEFLDPLSFHRGLNCRLAIELKVGRFEPEYLGKPARQVTAAARRQPAFFPKFPAVCAAVATG